MKDQLLPSLIFTAILFVLGCSSAESPTLRECRTTQEQLNKRIAVTDSLLNVQISQLRLQSETMSTDTLLSVDSMLRVQYAAIKEAVNQLEYKQSELHAWRDHLIVLPSKEEIAGGIRNPFGENTGDAGILSALNAYSDTLATLEVTISELIRTTTYERTSSSQPQE